MTYIATETEPGIFTVGTRIGHLFEPCDDEDYPTREDAERRARELNGIDCPLFEMEVSA